jgi:hypothetical protein
MALKSKVNFANSDLDKLIVAKDKKNSIQNFINSSFNSIVKENFRASKLGDSLSLLNMSNANGEENNSQRRSVSINFNSKNFPSKKSLKYESKQENDNYATQSQNKNDSMISILPSIGFNPGKETTVNEKREDSNTNIKEKIPMGNIFRGSFWNNVSGLQAGVSSYNPNNTTQAQNFLSQTQIIKDNRGSFAAKSDNDISLSVIKRDKNPHKSLINNGNVSFTLRNSFNTSEKKPSTVLSDFKKFTYKIQGRDELGNDIIDLDEKDPIITKDNDNSFIFEEKLLDDMNFVDPSEFADDVDEVNN